MALILFFMSIIFSFACMVCARGGDYISAIIIGVVAIAYLICGEIDNCMFLKYVKGNKKAKQDERSNEQ